ncbi:GumC family protein [Methylobacterium iners]|uniref:GumC family protein n=1 Tax=Methylobacterium iners TaxID=418707 RepID=UPI001EE1ACA7|nr:polysaccharide biosynthesis tyrosine autokinase [Methylobacterium iners]
MTRNEPADGLIDLRSWRSFVLRHGRLIGTIAGAILLAAVLALAVMERAYTATSVLLVDPRQSKLAPTEAVLAGIGNDALAVESQVEILESSVLARRVIAELGLAEQGELARNSVIETLQDWVGLRTADEEKALDRVVSRFQERLKVRRRGLTYVLEVSYTANDAALAARVTNALAAAYLADQVATKLQATTRASGLLDGRLDELRKRAQDAERAVSAFKNENNIVDAGSGGTLLELQISELNQQLATARARSAETAARFAQVRRAVESGAGAAGLPEALQSQVIGGLRTQYAQLSALQGELNTTLGPRHPSVGNIGSQLKDVGALIDKELGRVMAGVRNENETSLSRERSLEASLRTLTKQAVATSQARVRLAELEREAAASKAIIDQYLLRSKEIQEQQTLQTADARVLSPASPPQKPSSPKTVLVLFLALFVGLGGGVAAAAARESFDGRLRSVRSVEEGLGLSVIGVLPSASPMGGSAPRRPSLWWRFNPPAADDREAFADAARALGGQVRQHLAKSGGRTLLVTSTGIGEGKTTVAEALAETLARRGGSVLSLSLDLRKAGGNDEGRFDRPGLLDALREGKPIEAMIQRTSDDRRSILPLGRARGSAEAAELLEGAAMQTMLGRLRERFDVIVMDGASLAQGTDRYVAGELADRIVFVVEWARTERSEARAALGALGSAAGKVVGAVFNKVDAGQYALYERQT